MKGLRLYLTPFAPDQSGAESVLYELGGMIVILDAGGCAGNICGFDEPRWGKRRSAVFSAGLRDMDAVMGRDKLLVDKIVSCAKKIDPAFVAIIGTPVPAVIGTDLQAIRRMLERKIALPILTIPTDGMHLYDRGVELAYQEILSKLDRLGRLDRLEGESGRGSLPNAEEADLRPAVRTSQSLGAGKRVGVFGVTPLDLPDLSYANRMREALVGEGFDKVLLYGSGASLADYEQAGGNTCNIAASRDGIAAVRYLERKFGTPYQVTYPGADRILDQLMRTAFADSAISRILIVQGQILANSLREEVRLRHPDAEVRVASWFAMEKDLMEAGDRHMIEEEDFQNLAREWKPDWIIGDEVLKRMIPEYEGRFLGLPQFALSGKREAGA